MDNLMQPVASRATQEQIQAWLTLDEPRPTLHEFLLLIRLIQQDSPSALLH